MVKTWIDQLQADDGTTEKRLRLFVRMLVGSKSSASQYPTANYPVIALALINEFGFLDLPVSLCFEPLAISRGLGSPLVMAKPRKQHYTVDNRRAVGSEDHIRQAFDWFNELHLMSEV